MEVSFTVPHVTSKPDVLPSEIMTSAVGGPGCLPDLFPHMNSPPYAETYLHALQYEEERGHALCGSLRSTFPTVPSDGGAWRSLFIASVSVSHFF